MPILYLSGLSILQNDDEYNHIAPLFFPPCSYQKLSEVVVIFDPNCMIFTYTELGEGKRPVK
jgi:hypothetical protein